MGELTGKVAVVTGSAGGIGGAVVRALADAGAEVVGIDREQADLARGRRGRARVRRLERVDVLVNAAGISGRRLGDGPVDECTEEAWDAVLDANLKSVFLCCQHAIPRLRAAGGGAIVNVSSVLGLVGGDEDFATHAYAASKAGIVGLSRSIASTTRASASAATSSRRADRDADQPRAQATSVSGRACPTCSR